jgi:hypothetical protein
MKYSRMLAGVLGAVLLGPCTPVWAAPLTNGSFETGDFTGWTRSGFLGANSPSVGGPQFSTFLAAQMADPPKADTNAVETSQTTAFDGFGVAGPAIGPTNGNFLAFISNETSAGNSTLTGSSITQSFTIPAGATSLSFDVALLNNDDPSDFASFNDFGGVALLQGSTVLDQFNLDLDPASPANAHVTDGANAGGFINSTPFLHESFNVSGLGGQTVTLEAYSINYGGDNSVETRLLLDNIQIAAAVVPEPGSLTLLGTSLVGASMLVWRRRRGR